MDTLGSPFSPIALTSTNLVLIDQCSDLGVDNEESLT